MLNWPKKPKPEPDNQPTGIKLTLELSEPLARDLAQATHKGFTQWVPWVLAALATGLTGFYAIVEPDPDPVLKQSSPEVCPPQESQNG